MGNGKRATNGQVPNPEPPVGQDFVVVLAYTSTEPEVEENFGKLVQDLKALYTFKNDVRAYALVQDAAKNVLAKVEKSGNAPSGRAVLVISFDQPDEFDEAIEKTSGIADKVRSLFAEEHDVRVNVAIREAADEVLSSFPEETR